MDFYWFMLGALAVYRVTHLLSREDGPWDVVVRLRKLAGHGVWGALLDCFLCLSVWVSLPAAFLLGHSMRERAFLWLALSGAAILLEKHTERGVAPPARYHEDPEDHDVLLWKSPKAASCDAIEISPAPPGAD